MIFVRKYPYLPRLQGRVAMRAVLCAVLKAAPCSDGVKCESKGDETKRERDHGAQYTKEGIEKEGRGTDRQENIRGKREEGREIERQRQRYL